MLTIERRPQKRDTTRHCSFFENKRMHVSMIATMHCLTLCCQWCQMPRLAACLYTFSPSPSRPCLSSILPCARGMLASEGFWYAAVAKDLAALAYWLSCSNATALLNSTAPPPPPPPLPHPHPAPAAQPPLPPLKLPGMLASMLAAAPLLGVAPVDVPVDAAANARLYAARAPSQSCFLDFKSPTLFQQAITAVAAIYAHVSTRMHMSAFTRSC